jgi:hypothetical protein
LLPFTHHQFALIFALYNAAIWPLQPIVHVAGLAMLFLLLRSSRRGDTTTLLFLSAVWIWTGLVYQIGFFSRINPVALAFGVAFVVEGLLLGHAAWRGTVTFGTASGLGRAMGWSLLTYSLVIYPLLGIAMGDRYLDLPAFGLTPCPVTMTTVGVLLLASGPVPRRLYVVPVAWAMLAGSAAGLLRMPQDWALLLAPVALAIVAAHKRFRKRPVREAHTATGAKA